MSVTAVNTNPIYADYVNSFSDTNSVRRVNEIKLQQDEKTFIKYTPQDRKDTIVSEKLDEKDSGTNYNFQFQSNTPLSKLLETIKAFNETRKTNKAKTEDDDYTDFIDLPETDEDKINDSSKGIGYYIVMDQRNQTSDTKLLKKFSDPWKEKINRTYNVGFRKNPGTLVNLLV